MPPPLSDMIVTYQIKKARDKGEMTNLQKIRERKGMTKTELANATDLKYKDIHRIENGERSSANITLATAVKLALALECHAEDLLD